MKTKLALASIVSTFYILHSAYAFEGRIAATLTRGSEAQHLLYTVGTNSLCVERADTDRPRAWDIVNLRSGAVTLVFPHNRSFMRLKNNSGAGIPPVSSAAALASRADANPQLIGGMQMPSRMMRPPLDTLALKATRQTTNLLGFACRKFAIQARGETMEIWATDQLLPVAPYLENPPSRFGPCLIEQQWAGLLQAQSLFPVLAVLKFENGRERLRYVVSTVTPQTLTDDDQKLFTPPDGYIEIEPLPL